MGKCFPPVFRQNKTPVKNRGESEINIYEEREEKKTVKDCVLLFSTLKRFEAFPIDVWVNRVMNELYIHGDENKINKNPKAEIINFL